MTTVYKLTTQDNKTRKGEKNECTWGPGVSHSGTGEGALCGPGFIHAYLSPELAVLLNPIHANISNPKLWECETEIVKNDRGLKIGGVSLTTLREIPLPQVTNEQRVIFGILCGQAVFGGKSSVWDKWAEEYVSGKNRAAACAAACAAYAADAAAFAACDACYACADYAAACAAYAAARATYSTDTATKAADAAAWATARATADFDIVKLAQQALSMK